MSGTATLAMLALIAHILSAVVWVGGMFFALLVLRPASGTLEPGPRLRLWLGVFERFFAWVIAAIVLLLISGFTMIFGMFAPNIPLHVNLMMGLGIIMVLAFFHLYFAPWRRFRAAVAAGDNPGAARQLGQIRVIVALNLVLGLITAAIGSSGRYWG